MIDLDVALVSLLLTLKNILFKAEAGFDRSIVGIRFYSSPTYLFIYYLVIYLVIYLFPYLSICLLIDFSHTNLAICF